MRNFKYKHVATLEEASTLLCQYQGKAKILAGGTDILGRMKRKLLELEAIIDIKGIPGLDEMRYSQDKGLVIGALVSIREIETANIIQEKFTVISESAELLGSLQIRNRATLGGNLCNASPSADMAPCLIAMGARVTILGEDGTREVFLEDFFSGPGSTVLGPGEILKEVLIPNINGGMVYIYIKHTLRKAMDLAIVGVAAGLALDEGKRCRDVKIVLGAVAPIPIRGRNAENLLSGKKIDDELIREASNLAAEESRPITDLRGTAEYRKEMVRVMVRTALERALGKLG